MGPLHVDNVWVYMARRWATTVGVYGSTWQGALPCGSRRTGLEGRIPRAAHAYRTAHGPTETARDSSAEKGFRSSGVNMRVGPS